MKHAVNTNKYLFPQWDTHGMISPLIASVVSTFNELVLTCQPGSTACVVVLRNVNVMLNSGSHA